MRTLNLGILAHVDAGKTSLTERLLFAAGVIDTVGRVDYGNTQTDTLALERQRGITIRSAVVSFVIGDTAVNLIDTPGHPDFIAEVERVLKVLDGAILVISAVEGVQAQTRLLMRTLRRLGIPTILFVNKIDRSGADLDRTFHGIKEKLTPMAIQMGTADGLGTAAATFSPIVMSDARLRARLVETLAEHDDSLLDAYVQDESALPDGRVRETIAEQTRRAIVYPVFAGSAITGAGADALTAGIRDLRGWQVTDCTVSLIECDYSVADGPPSRRGPDSTAADFRKLTPLVVMSALAEAGTEVCEPVHRFELEIPADALGAVLPALTRLRAIPETPRVQGSWYVLAGVVPAARVHELRQLLTALTHGEGVLATAFDHYAPVRGPVPTRPRTDENPLNREEYLMRLAHRIRQ